MRKWHAQNERGFLTPQYLIAIAISLIVFITMVNGAMILYTRGVIRASLDEAVRAGSRAAASIPNDGTNETNACNTVANKALHSGIGTYVFSSNQVQLGPPSQDGTPCWSTPDGGPAKEINATVRYTPTLWVLPTVKVFQIDVSSSTRVENGN